MITRRNKAKCNETSCIFSGIYSIQGRCNAIGCRFPRSQVERPAVYLTEQINTSLSTLIARFIGPTWGPPGADRTHVGPMWATWTGRFCGEFTGVLFDPLWTNGWVHNRDARDLRLHSSWPHCNGCDELTTYDVIILRNNRKWFPESIRSIYDMCTVWGIDFKMNISINEKPFITKDDSSVKLIPYFFAPVQIQAPCATPVLTTFRREILAWKILHAIKGGEGRSKRAKYEKRKKKLHVWNHAFWTRILQGGSRAVWFLVTWLNRIRWSFTGFL